MTVHNPMPFELKVSNVVSNGLQVVNAFSLMFISKLVDLEISYSVTFFLIYCRVYCVRELIMSVIQLVYHYLQSRGHSR